MTSADRRLNLGCGTKHHPAWTNVDFDPDDPAVIPADFRKPLPFPEAAFEVVYHSQVLEHLPRSQVLAFLKECNRVLIPGGWLRVVVPDLEGLVLEYQKWLAVNLQHPDPVSDANYEWILMELFDQMTRDQSGGEMAGHLARLEGEGKSYVESRIGNLRRYLHGGAPFQKHPRRLGMRRLFGRAFQKVVGILQGERYRLGAFRQSGEVHRWMYDRYSLGRLLGEAGFREVRVMSPTASQIPGWREFGLDQDGQEVLDPSALFMEGRKEVLGQAPLDT